MGNYDLIPLSERCEVIFITKPWEWECELPKEHKGDHEAVITWTDEQVDRRPKGANDQ